MPPSFSGHSLSSSSKPSWPHSPARRLRRTMSLPNVQPTGGVTSLTQRQADSGIRTLRSRFFMSKIGVGIIGASPLRPGWAVAAHLPALASLPDYELRAVATSSEASAKAAGDAYGVPAYSDPSLLIARPDVDLVVVTVRLAHHHALISQAVAAVRWSCRNGRWASILLNPRILL